MLNNVIAENIARHSLMIKNRLYIVALSGGADSVTLLIVLKQLGYNIEAAHCNFHLRGEESTRDENFCVDLCKKYDIVLHRVHFDTLAYADLHKVSVEMAARDLRYDYFEKLRKDINADGICVAHHRDDNVETLLLNLIRGTGLKGLTGMSPRNGFIIRPMLDVSRSNILTYLLSIKQDYVTDSSNLENDVTRNKIRLDIIPMLNKINPSVSENIAKTERLLREAERVVDCSMDEAINRILTTDGSQILIDCAGLKETPSPEYTLFYILRRYGFTSSQISQIAECLNGESGKEWTSSTHALLFDRNRIIVEPISKEVSRKMRIPEEGIYVYSDTVKFDFSVLTIDADFKIDRNSRCAYLDKNKVKFPLTIRVVENGDRFAPFGMKGTKLVSDYLTDCKKSVFDKRRQLVITDSEGTIIWLVNERPSEKFKITKDSQRALRILLL